MTIRAGETYALPQNLTAAETVAFWRAAAHEVFVAEADGAVVGTYFLRADQGGRGAHVGSGAASRRSAVSPEHSITPRGATSMRW